MVVSRMWWKSPGGAFRAYEGSGSHSELLYDRMKTAVLGEGPDGVISYNTGLVALLNHYGAIPRACRPYRAKTKGKVERPYRYVRQDFFLGRPFRNLDDLNAQFSLAGLEIANVRIHATTGRSSPSTSPRSGRAHRPSAIPYSAVLTVERRVTHDGIVSVGGNL